MRLDDFQPPDDDAFENYVFGSEPLDGYVARRMAETNAGETAVTSTNLLEFKEVAAAPKAPFP
jgi:hypothetical protein